MALVLLFLFVVPGVAYLVLRGKDQTLDIAVIPQGPGVDVVQVASSGAVARRRGRAFLNDPAQAGAQQGQVAAGQVHAGVLGNAALAEPMPRTVRRGCAER